MKNLKRIVITSGDLDGVGLEISIKSLYQTGPRSGFQFFLWRSKKTPDKMLRRLDNKYNRITVNTWEQALEIKSDQYNLIDIASSDAPPFWVERTAKAGVQQQVDALVTAPLSKTLIHDSGLRDKGHTDILKRVCKVDSVFMLFLGSSFNVLLATDHIPIAQVSDELTPSRLWSSVQAAHGFCRFLPRVQSTKPIALLGLNPHSGELGLLGRKELDVHQKVLTKALRHQIALEGPLVPDVAFQKKMWKRFSIYIASYHDQGLIPFKMAHGHGSGVHLSVGLPFVRTSVDHGTAKDLFGKNKANPGSLTEALGWAIKLTSKR